MITKLATLSEGLPAADLSASEGFLARVCVCVLLQALLGRQNSFTFWTFETFGVLELSLPVAHNVLGKGFFFPEGLVAIADSACEHPGFHF